MSDLYYSAPGNTHFREAAARGAAGRSPGASTVDAEAGIYGVRAGEFELTPRTYWPTTIFSRTYRDHARDAASIISYLYELKSRASGNIASGIAPTSKSKEGLFESTFDLFETTKHVELKRLVAFIESSIQRVVWYVNDRSMDPNRIRVKFTDSWFHITNNSGFHDAHYHGGCSWCGVYYLQISDVPSERPAHAPNGVNRFYSPRPYGGMFSDLGNAYLGHGHVDVPPTPGLFILFPAYLLHSGLPYAGEKDRVILSFNSQSTLASEVAEDEGNA